MKLDIALPSLLLIITLASAFSYPRLRERFRSILGPTKLGIRDAVIVVILMGAAVTVIAIIPEVAVLVFFSASYMIALFTFTYALTRRWYIAACASTLYILVYAFLWNSITLNLFSIMLAVLVSTLIGTSLNWRTATVFASLLIVMDVIHVFGTGFMVISAQKLIALRLPVAVILPMFPSEGPIGLGLGDLFLAGVLAIQTVERYGMRTGLASTGLSALAFVAEESIWLGSGIGFFPATIMIGGGWLASLGAIETYNRFLKPKTKGDRKEPK